MNDWDFHSYSLTFFPNAFYISIVFVEGPAEHMSVLPQKWFLSIVKTADETLYPIEELEVIVYRHAMLESDLLFIFCLKWETFTVNFGWVWYLVHKFKGLNQFSVGLWWWT